MYNLIINKYLLVYSNENITAADKPRTASNLYSVKDEREPGAAESSLEVGSAVT